MVVGIVRRPDPVPCPNCALVEWDMKVDRFALLATMVLVLARDLRRVPSAATGIAFFFTIAAHLMLTSPDYAVVRALDLFLYPCALVRPRYVLAVQTSAVR